MSPAAGVETTAAELSAITRAAADAATTMSGASPLDRARWLEAMADALHDSANHLVLIAARETRLPEPRLRGELQRTVVQLRSFAEPLRTGELLEIIIDHADPDHPLAPSPDLRRMLRGIGPVAVYAASNFPFAFSVAGGDTASAIAAGCPVVVKAHPGHPDLSIEVGRVLTAALDAAGAPAGALAVVLGFDCGIALVADSAIAAAAFTGSTAGGRALWDAANTRPVPIPFYGELGSINPVFVTSEAAATRGAGIARGFVGSFTLGVGQFCTKPGVLIVPAGAPLVDEIVTAVLEVAERPMLTDGMVDRVAELDSELSEHPDVDVLVQGRSTADGRSPHLVRVDAPAVLADPSIVRDERFGPSAVIVECPPSVPFSELAELFEGTLTATVQLNTSSDEGLADLLSVLQERAGRVIANDWPTGVSVSASMQHGGPYPAATTALYTSVGITAARRFQRPVCWQGMPAELLPRELLDANPWGLRRRVDGCRTTRSSAVGDSSNHSDEV